MLTILYIHFFLEIIHYISLTIEWERCLIVWCYFIHILKKFDKAAFSKQKKGNKTWEMFKVREIDKKWMNIYLQKLTFTWLIFVCANLYPTNFWWFAIFSVTISLFLLLPLATFFVIYNGKLLNFLIYYFLCAQNWYFTDSHRCVLQCFFTAYCTNIASNFF